MSHEADGFDLQATVVVDRGAMRRGAGDRRVLVALGGVAAVLGVVAVVLALRGAPAEGDPAPVVTSAGEDPSPSPSPPPSPSPGAEERPAAAPSAEPGASEPPSSVPPSAERAEPRRAPARSGSARATRAAYNDARRTTQKAMEAKGVRRGDDDELDRALRSMQRAARQKRWDEALEAAGAAGRRAEAVRIDKAFVLQKLSRFNRAYDAVKDDSVKAALTRLSVDISRALKEGRFDDANRLVNQGSDQARKGR